MPDDINKKLNEYLIHRYPELMKFVQDEKTFISVQENFNKTENKWTASVEFHTGQNSLITLLDYKLNNSTFAHRF
jgi:hypothetical protein